MARTTTGGCLCGAVKYEISGEFDGFFLCHCSRCRKDTGSAHAANLFSSTAALTWLTGQEAIKTYRVPETRHQRSFCTECGSALPGLHRGGTLLVVPAGSADGDIDMRPTAHICYASRAKWDDRLDDLAKFDGLPT